LALLVDGLLIPDGGDVHVPAGELFGYGERAFQVLLEGQKVPDLGRHGHRGQQRHRLPVHHRLLRCRLHQLPGQLEDRSRRPLINASIDAKAADSLFHALMDRAQIQQTALTVKDHRHQFTPVTSADRRQLHRFLLLLRHRKVRSMS
jgi:hypothetical protein